MSMILHNKRAFMTEADWHRVHSDYKGTWEDGSKSVLVQCPIEHGTRIYPAVIVSKPRYLQCACCGSDAGKWSQWHNQDAGYGMCSTCVDRIIERGQEYMDRQGIDIDATYGIAGVHRAPSKHEAVCKK